MSRQQRVEATHRLLLRQLLDSIDFLQGQIDAISTDIDTLLRPHEKLSARLMQIPGLGPIAAALSPTLLMSDSYPHLTIGLGETAREASRQV